VIDPVWELYRETIELAGPVSTLIEWDEDIPALPVLLSEAERARTVRDAALAARRERVERGLPANAVPARPPTPLKRRSADSDHQGWQQGGPREHAGTGQSAA
jgi:hypothetical protein